MTGTTGPTARPVGGWHVDPALASAYADGRTDPVLTASLEQHVVACADCRALLGGLTAPERLDTTWAAVLDEVQRPRPRLLERWLTALGLSPSEARLAALTPLLSGAWLTGVVAVLALALAMAYADPRGVALFLTLAPLLPAAGVALAFGPHADPAHELAAAAPYPALRLLALRTAVVVATTFPVAGLAGALLPGSPWLSVAWLLPAFALATATLAVGSRVSPLTTVVVLASAWSALALTGVRPHGDPELVAGPAVQLTCLALFLTCLLALVRERRELPEMIRRIA